MTKNIIISVLCVISLCACATKQLPVQEAKTTLANPTEAAITETDSARKAAAPAVATTPPVKVETAQRVAKVEPSALQPVYFDYDSYLLTDKAREILNGTSALFLKNRELKAIVAGHCDDRGSEMYNIALGEKRAQAVKSYLISLGIDGGRLEIVSYGEERPAVNGVDEASRALNRRAEFM